MSQPIIMELKSIDKFISGIPKAELHLHIEGTFEPENIEYLATVNGGPDERRWIILKF